MKWREFKKEPKHRSLLDIDGDARGNRNRKKGFRAQKNHARMRMMMDSFTRSAEGKFGSNADWGRARTCSDKVFFSSIQAAIRNAIANKITRSKDSWIYKCPYCEGYHLTTHPREDGEYLWSTVSTRD